MKQLDECAHLEDKATFCFLKGWLLNIRNDYNKEVFDLLTKSIKLRPNYHDAWIELGECYFKKGVYSFISNYSGCVTILFPLPIGDYRLALNSFETVLKNSPNEKKALRNASIMLRSLPCSGEERKPNLLKSIELAKKAVERDLNDGHSWACLANAYLTHLFMSSRMEHDSLTKNCKSAYQKALVDVQVSTKADVWFNYFAILLYEEEFEEALKCLSSASKYDSQWLEPTTRKNNLTAILSDICQKQTDASCVKAKKRHSMIEKIKADEEKIRVRYANAEDMCNGNLMQVNQLNEGVNSCLLLCKVLSYTSDSNHVFHCSVFHAIDSCGQNIALFIYDIVRNKALKAGDQILILFPVLKRHLIEFEGKQYAFKAIKIVNPMQIFVNNNRLGIDCLSIPVVNVTLKSD